MKEIIVGIFIALLSQSIVKTWERFFDHHYNNNLEICQKAVHLAKYCTDTRDYWYELLPSSVKVEQIKENACVACDLYEKLEVQRVTAPISSWLLGERELAAMLHILWDYLADPVLLPNEKKFDENTRLQPAFYKALEKAAKRPVIRFRVYSLILSVLLSGIGVLAFVLAS